ncbi:hypothetical protein L9F63_003329, partial [Diploptera punctata]
QSHNCFHSKTHFVFSIFVSSLITKNQDEKRSPKKVKKIKSKEGDKPESEQTAPSKATSLVRKLSIGKRRTNSGKLIKSTSENSTNISKTDVSTEDDRFSTASSSTTGGRQSLEEGSNNKTMDQSETSWSADVRRSESEISEGFGISHDPTLEDVHSLMKIDSPRRLSSEVEEDEQVSIASYAPKYIHSPPSIENEQLARLEILLNKTYNNDVNETTTKDQILQITAPALTKQNMEDSGECTLILFSAQQMSEKNEHLYKILVIGELGTGKTSIIKRYVHQFFSQHYRATIGVDFALKVLNWDANTVIRLQLWDIAGQERFGNMTRVYYKEAVGAFIVFDVTRTATFEAVVKWKQDLDTKVQLADGSPIPCVLLANKCDQQKEGIVNNASKMEEYCRERGFTSWFETSAKENINIEEAARCLVTQILQNDKLMNHNDSRKDVEKFALENKNQREQKNSKTCSC